MQVIARRTLAEFWERHQQAEGPVRVWFAIVSKARWQTPNDVKRQFGPTVDFVGDNRVIFDLGGNKYRLIAVLKYRWQIVYIRYILTHREYTREKWKP